MILKRSNIIPFLNTYFNLFKYLAPKILGPWIDQGTCQAVGKDPACGPGMQIQKRSCEDGTIDKCEFMDSQRAISCADAGSALPACQIGISNSFRLIEANSIFRYS